MRLSNHPAEDDPGGHPDIPDSSTPSPDILDPDSPNFIIPGLGIPSPDLPVHSNPIIPDPIIPDTILPSPDLPDLNSSNPIIPDPIISDPIIPDTILPDPDIQDCNVPDGSSKGAYAGNVGEATSALGTEMMEGNIGGGTSEQEEDRGGGTVLESGQVSDTGTSWTDPNMFNYGQDYVGQGSIASSNVVRLSKPNPTPPFLAEGIRVSPSSSQARVAGPSQRSSEADQQPSTNSYLLPDEPVRCSLNGCRFPHDRRKPARHAAEFHGQNHTISWKKDGQPTPQPVQRTNGKLGKLACPCGNPQHDRYSYQLLRKICLEIEDHKIFDGRKHVDHYYDKYLEAKDKSRFHEVDAGTRFELNSGHVKEVTWDLVEVEHQQTTRKNTEDGDAEAVDTGNADAEAMDTGNADAEAVDTEGASGQVHNTDGSLASENSAATQELEAFIIQYLPDATQTETTNSAAGPTTGTPLSEPEQATEVLRKEYNTIVESQFNLPVCLDCLQVIPPDRMLEHQTKFHLEKSDIAVTSEEFIHLLNILGAKDLSHVPRITDGPIPRLDLVKVVEGYRCQECGLVNHGESTSKQHRQKMHKGEGVKADKVRAQMFNPEPMVWGPKTAFYLEVQQNDVVQSSATRTVLQSVEKMDLCGYGNVLGTGNTHQQNPVLTQLKWIQLLNGVDWKALHDNASYRVHTGYPKLLRLRKMGRALFHGLIKTLEATPYMTLKYIRSSKPNQPASYGFRHPQEHGTVTRDANMMIQFLSFLYLSIKSPVKNFPVPISSNTTKLLVELVENLGTPEDEKRKEMKDEIEEEEEEGIAEEWDFDMLLEVQEVIWSLLTDTSAEYKRNENMCPLTRFLIAANFDSSGRFASAAQITPMIARIQWCLRACAVLQIELMKVDFDNSQEAYEKEIQKYLTIGPRTLFTSLRQSMQLIRSIAFRQPALPRFVWDQGRANITLDGSPISVKGFFDSFPNAIKRLEQSISTLFGEFPYLPILAEIDRRTDPLHPAEWYKDALSNDKPGQSLFAVAENGFKIHKIEFLNWMCNNKKFCLQSDTGRVEYRKGALCEWFETLNEVICGLYYLILCTGGGGARGTEFENLLFTNETRQHRNLFILNGSLTIITDYIKTQSLTGAGKTIARTPAPAVGRLAILVYGVVSYVAATIGADSGFLSATEARAYLHHMFLRSGTPLISADFSKIVAQFNRHAVGYDLKLADFRQLMTALQVAFVGASIADPLDTENPTIATVHSLFGRTVAVGRAHYAKDQASAATRLASDLLTEMQAISFQWHKVIGLSRLSAVEENEDIDGLPMETSASKIISQITKGIQSKLEEHDTALKNILGIVQDVRDDIQGLKSDMKWIVKALGRGRE
ncbi:hypothetical protein AAF712_014899 [Marasmius tenuissimus]|uniref:C2H2-type domain-containing protein n=1 Tax=Marasmius tenuissimus TaxID=585030 RepID=A0ABR2ZAV9_9AGAR